ncbi:chaperonin 10-like protein [Aspergillus venezuelensis]
MASTIPSSTRALVYISKGLSEIQKVPTPTLHPTQLLIKPNAVGLNPTDWKHIDGANTLPGSRIGCDYAGTVVAVGSAVRKPFNVGDRVTGVVHGGDRVNLESGAFGGFIVAKGDLQIRTPENVKDEEAATLGISVATVGQGLYRTLGLPLPNTPEAINGSNADKYILIHGGSTATGIYGIQYAKLSGYKVLATSSPHNFEYLKSLGAEEVFDYKTPNIGAEIRGYTNNALKLAWDCTGFGAEIIANALSSEGGKYAAIMAVDKDEVAKVNPNVDGPYLTIMYSIFGERYEKFGMVVEAMPEEYEFAKEFWELTRGLLADGNLTAPRVTLNRGGEGLEGVLKGLDELRANRVSGGKLVYTL